MPKKGKTEKKESESKKKRGLSRRQVLKVGAVTGGLTVLTSTKAFKTHFLDREVYAQESSSSFFVPKEPEPCSVDEFAGSPPTRPFRQQLPIPPALQPTSLFPAPTRTANIGAGEAPRASHQRWSEFLPQRQYSLRARPALQRFHPDLPPSYIWGFNGVVQGPTILERYGRPTIVRFFNDLPDEAKFGVPEITVHLHNGHTPSESDGFAGDFFGPKLWKDNHYPNVLAGFDAFPATRGDQREAQYSYWYHDHRAMATAPSTYRGLAGMYLLFDNRDSGNENDPNPNALRLPSGYGQFDIPLEFSDKLFCEDGTLLADPSGFVFQGDKWCVNGAVQPFLPVKRRKYRFRLLNTGPERTWIHKLVRPSGNLQGLTVIATDGNLLRNPITVGSITHSTAERYDVVVDFSNTRIGDKLFLINDNPEDDPAFVGFPSPTPLPPGIEIEQVVMRFDVVGDATDNSRVPSTLTSYPPLNTNIAAFKTWEFTRNDEAPEGLQFQVNGKTFDASRSDHQARRGTAEIWTLRNLVPEADWTHPVHIHFEEFRILERNGAPPPALESGRKDVIRLPPGNEIKLYMQFRDFLGKYLIHCHNMNHEDVFMMVRWDIVP